MKKTGETVTHSFQKPGSSNVILTVTDNRGGRTSDNTIVIITKPNQPPQQPIIYGPQFGFTNHNYLYAIISSDADDEQLNFIVDWGDGSIDESGFRPWSTQLDIEHTWDEPGEYQIKVTASDGQSQSTSELTVEITNEIEAENIALVILAILALLGLIYAAIRRKKKKQQ